MEKPKKQNPDRNEISNKFQDKDEDKYNVESSSANDLSGCATTDMTGLIPSAIESDAELESYKDLYPFSPTEFVEKQ